jgi:hypothetical protein
LLPRSGRIESKTVRIERLPKFHQLFVLVWPDRQDISENLYLIRTATVQNQNLAKSSPANYQAPGDIQLGMPCTHLFLMHLSLQLKPNQLKMSDTSQLLRKLHPAAYRARRRARHSATRLLLGHSLAAEFRVDPLVKDLLVD